MSRTCSRAAYADLFLCLLDCALLIDPQTLEILDANDASEKVLGLPADDVIRRSLLDFISPDQVDDFTKNVRVAQRRYHPREIESVWKNLNGNFFPVRVTLSMLTLNDQSAVLQVLARDITSEREAQRKIETYVAELEVLNKKLTELSITDAMTGLFNFRHFQESLRVEHARAARYNTEYSIVLLDADHFKIYNDTNGHPQGDELLRQIASVIRAQCRNTDLAARYGGEEFIVLCPETSASAALVLAERIRQEIAGRDFPGGKTQPSGRVSVSLGISSFPASGKTKEEVVQAADQALYQSKKAGRNRATIFGMAPQPESVS